MGFVLGEMVESIVFSVETRIRDLLGLFGRILRRNFFFGGNFEDLGFKIYFFILVNRVFLRFYY